MLMNKTLLLISTLWLAAAVVMLRYDLFIASNGVIRLDRWTGKCEVGTPAGWKPIPRLDRNGFEFVE